MKEKVRALDAQETSPNQTVESLNFIAASLSDAEISKTIERSDPFVGDCRREAEARTSQFQPTKEQVMRIDEDILPRILRAAMRLECPTTSDIAAATGICECCVETNMRAAERLGFVEFEHSDPRSARAEIDLGWLMWSITPDTVREFCYANDEAPLTDQQMDELFTILHEQFDQYELLVEAIHCLRTGQDRYPTPMSSEQLVPA
jgi:hypothetical protein